MSNTDTDPNQIDKLGLGPNIGDPPGWNPLSAPYTPPPADPMESLKNLDYSYRPQRQPPQQTPQQPQLPGGLPPAIGNFLGSIGVTVPRDPSRPPPQGMPPPTWPPMFRDNRRQMYTPSQANRPPNEIGMPPRFPQTPDMWQVPAIYEGVGRQMARWGGSEHTRWIANNLSQHTNAYMRGVRGGQREYSRAQYQRMSETADALQNHLQAELQNYRGAFASYTNNPEQLQSDLLQRAMQSNDLEMQAAINTGPREAERLLQWRQAKFDDLHRSNTARKEHEEELRAMNPFSINPVGPDGSPTARLPKPFETKPERMVPDRVAFVPRAPLYKEKGPENDPESYGVPLQQPVERPQPEYPGGGPEMETPEQAEMDRDPDLRPMGEDTPQPIPPDKKLAPEPGTDSAVEGREQEAQRDNRVRLAQADTGTMSDAVTLPQINVKAGEDEEDPNERTIWDDVRLRSERRQAAEDARQGGTGDRPSAAAPSPAGAQPPQPPAPSQPQGAAGGQPPGQQQGGPAGGPGAQTPVQASPAAQAGPQATPAAEGEQRPLTMTPALQQAQKNNLSPEDVNGMAMRHLFGHMSHGQFRSLKGPLRDAVTARETEVYNTLQGLIQRGLKGDELLTEIDKINPILAQDMRAFKAGGPPPKKDESGLFRALMFNYDPSLNEQTYKTRATTMDNFAKGPASNNLKSAGTFIRHANRLEYNLEHAPDWYWEALYGVMPGRLSSRWMPETRKIMQEMEVDRDAMGAEFATSLAQGGGGGRGATGQERAEQGKHIDLYAPQAALDRVREMKRLVEERVKQLQQQYETGTGMSFDAIRKQFDIPGMSEPDQKVGQPGGGLPPGVSIRKLP